MRRPIKRRLAIFAAAIVVGLAALTAVAVESGASFTSSSSSKIEASTAGVTSLLHLHSESTDPDGLTGYYRRTSPSGLAATGVDGSLAVNLGQQPNGNTTQVRVFTIKAASSLPAGITSITVTATTAADPGGTNPVRSVGFASVGSTQRNNPVTLTAGQKMQCNMQTLANKISGVSHPTIILTVTYSGFTGTLFRHSVPVTVLSASAPLEGLDPTEEELPSLDEGSAVVDDELHSPEAVPAAE